MLQHARRLLDDRPAVLGPGVQHGVQLALADDHVLLAAHARVVQELLDVEQPARRAVDGVLAVARAEQSPGDGDFGQVDGQLARRLLMVSDTSARPSWGREDVPAKMTSSIFAGAATGDPGRRAPR